MAMEAIHTVPPFISTETSLSQEIIHDEDNSEDPVATTNTTTNTNATTTTTDNIATEHFLFSSQDLSAFTQFTYNESPGASSYMDASAPSAPPPPPHSSSSTGNNNTLITTLQQGSSPISSVSGGALQSSSTRHTETRLATPLMNDTIQGDSTSASVSGSGSASVSAPWPLTSSSSTGYDEWNYYNYPPHTQRSHSLTMTQDTRQFDYTSQPRTAGPLIPQLDAHNSSQLQFPLNTFPGSSNTQTVLHPVMPSTATTSSSASYVPASMPTPNEYFATFNNNTYNNASTADPFRTSPRHLHQPVHPPSQRSHSYNDIPLGQLYNTTQFEQQQHIHQPDDAHYNTTTPHHAEQFTHNDIQILKSLLANGEKLKWRYISSRLSSVTGRRAASSTCAKKTRELFNLPSEQQSGVLGTSLPYVVHDAWDGIVEDIV